MDAGFFRVSRSAGIWGEGRGLSGRPGRKLKLEAECLAGGASKIHRILSASRRSLALRRRPVRPCAVSSSRIVPPTRRRRSPENGGGNELERYLASCLCGGACRLSHARRRVLGPSGAARRKSLGGGRREALGWLAAEGFWRVQL